MDAFVHYWHIKEVKTLNIPWVVELGSQVPPVINFMLMFFWPPPFMHESSQTYCLLN